MVISAVPMQLRDDVVELAKLHFDSTAAEVRCALARQVERECAAELVGDAQSPVLKV